MAEEQQEPAKGAAESSGATDEVVEAELIESEPADVAADATPGDPGPAAQPGYPEPTAQSDGPEPAPQYGETGPAAQANESLAAAAAASAAPAEGTGPAAEEWQLEQEGPALPPQYVVVEAPQPPPRRGNRGIGTLLALAGTVIYGGVLVGVAYLLEYLGGTPNVDFLQDWHFYLPVIVFAVVFILLVLLANRAGWWAYILGSLVVGLAVYFGSAGGDALIDQWNRAADPHTVADGLATPFVILAGIIAREVAVWWGSLIALRGRRVTARNRIAREAYDRDLTEFRARYGG